MKSIKLLMESYSLYIFLLCTAVMSKAGNFILPAQWRTSINAPAILILKSVSITIFVLNFLLIARFGILVKDGLLNNANFFTKFRLEQLLLMFLGARLIKTVNLFFKVIWIYPHTYLDLLRAILISYGEALYSLYRANFGNVQSIVVTFSFLLMFIYTVIEQRATNKPS